MEKVGVRGEVMSEDEELVVVRAYGHAAYSGLDSWVLVASCLERLSTSCGSRSGFSLGDMLPSIDAADSTACDKLKTSRRRGSAWGEFGHER